MELTKYLKSNQYYLINNIKIVHQHLLDKKFIIKSFYLDIDCSDEELRYDDYSEFTDHLPIKASGNFILLMKFSDSSGKEKGLNLSFRSNNLIAIALSGYNKKLAEEFINELSVKLKLKLYKYNPIAENNLKIKNGIDKCSLVLENNQEYHVRRNWQINNEKDVQSFLYPILKSHFMDLEDEFYLPAYAGISYKPDFGIPEFKLLIEIKFLRKESDLKKIQKEINDDSIGYIKSSEKYKKIIVFIYNNSNISITSKYIKDLEKNRVITKIIIAPGISIINK